MKRIIIMIVAAVSLLASAVIFWPRPRAKADPVAEARKVIGLKRATSALAKLRREQPDNPEVHLLSARQARLEGQTDEALRHLERAETLGFPRDVVSRERVLTIATIDYPRSIPALDQLRREYPEDPEVLLVIAEGELKAGRREVAVEIAGKALEALPGSAQALRIRGTAWMELRRLDLAKADLEQAVESGKDSLTEAPARLGLATCLLDLGEFTRASELFQASHDEDPENLLALFGLGRAASFLGQLDKAEACFREILVRRPDHVETLLALAQVLEQRDELPGALAQLERAVKVEPNRLTTLARLAKLYGALGQNERAAKHEARYVELDPTRNPSGALPKPKEKP